MAGKMEKMRNRKRENKIVEINLNTLIIIINLSLMKMLADINKFIIKYEILTYFPRSLMYPADKIISKAGTT